MELLLRGEDQRPETHKTQKCGRKQNFPFYFPTNTQAFHSVINDSESCFCYVSTLQK